MQVVYLDQDKNWTRALYFIIIQESTVGHDQKLVVFCLIHLIYGSISCTYNVENSTRRVLKTAQRGVLQTQILCTVLSLKKSSQDNEEQQEQQEQHTKL